MLELPESTVLARQLDETVRGGRVATVVAGASPHKFAFYHGDPAAYASLLTGQVLGGSTGLGAMVELRAGELRLVLGDGANLRYYEDAAQAPSKHQLFVGLENGGCLVCTIQMYGTILLFPNGACENPYYLTAREKPSPLTGLFDRDYFHSLFTPGMEKFSAKAFLATGQRIPGLGNGVLQDILLRARIHPKRKIGTLSEQALDGLFHALRNMLSEMAGLGGRDTEKDLFGRPGGYRTMLSKNTVGKPCPVCGAEIQKTAYLGGAVYWCPVCQSLPDT